MLSKDTVVDDLVNWKTASAVFFSLLYIAALFEGRKGSESEIYDA